MANTPKKVAQVVLGTTDTLIYTAPTSGYTTLAAAVICNLSGSQALFNIHHCGVSGTALSSNALFYKSPLEASSVVEVGRGWTFRNGEQLRGYSNLTNTIVITVMGIEVL